MKAWKGNSARITISASDAIQPNGQQVSVLTIIDRDMPFLFDSVMGEVTSTHRDITLAVHPILDFEPGSSPTLYSHERSQANARHVSFISRSILHL